MVQISHIDKSFQCMQSLLPIAVFVGAAVVAGPRQENRHEQWLLMVCGRCECVLCGVSGGVVAYTYICFVYSKIYYLLRIIYFLVHAICKSVEYTSGQATAYLHTNEKKNHTRSLVTRCSFKRLRARDTSVHCSTSSHLMLLELHWNCIAQGTVFEQSGESCRPNWK